MRALCSKITFRKTTQKNFKKNLGIGHFINVQMPKMGLENGIMRGAYARLFNEIKRFSDLIK